MPTRISSRYEGSTESPERKERRKHRSSKSKRRSSAKGDQDNLERSSTLADSSSRRKPSTTVPELQRRATSASPNGSKTNLAYPSFSKAHSREAVGSRDSLVTPQRKNVFTPDPTDIQQRKVDGEDVKAVNHTDQHAAAVNGPPSPPLTANDQAAVTEDKRRDLEQQGEETGRKLSEAKENKTRGAESGRSKSARASPMSAMKTTKAAETTSHTTPSNSKPGTPLKMKPKHASVDDGSTILSRPQSRSASTSSAVRSTLGSTLSSKADSESTSVTPKRNNAAPPLTPDADDEASPIASSNSSAKTPTPKGTPFPASARQAPLHIVPSSNAIPSSNGASPMPPPPPPPPAVSFQAPRVDYLLHNGGLPHGIPKKFVSAPEPQIPSAFTVGEMPNPTETSRHVQSFFAPYSNLLEDIDKIMSKNGSIAVATGYRSIARRLLDRLEDVFARDISSEICSCIMCSSYDTESLADERGVSWGEILEFVSGRQELPAWPPFVLDQTSIGLGISSDIKAPMQKLDIDVPEEYRAHYVKQSKKTKQSVDRWLAAQGQDSNDAPAEADDDTLTFAILTHLEAGLRPIFSQLLGVSTDRPPSIQPGGSRAQTPLNAPKSELLSKTAIAIQRLYRLANSPRSPECAIYLLNNRSLHNVLATIAAISDGEWDILISGRFDGFLRSGADDVSSASANPSRGPTPAGNGRASRGPPQVSTPGPPSASAGAPVAMDEETEIAVLAEVEREIWAGMEALEDAFEALHLRAEGVRRALRERGAGLSMASQARKGAAAGVVEARLGTPADARGWESETDDGFDDVMSELAPDDSASNVSSSRIRRPRRRNERRTPAVLEEESEDGSLVGEVRTKGPWLKTK